MTDLAIRPAETTRIIPAGVATTLRGKMRGPVVLPGDEGYDAARTIWNAMIDRSPALAARCLDAADVTTRSEWRARKTCCSRCAAAATTSPATRCATAACSSICP